jgi:hypothetical protein
MKSVAFITPLITKVIRECDMCHEQKTVEYLAVDKDDKMFNVCSDCRNIIQVEDPNN